MRYFGIFDGHFRQYKMEKGRRQAMGKTDEQEEEVTPNPFPNANLLIRKRLSFQLPLQELLPGTMESSSTS